MSLPKGQPVLCSFLCGLQQPHVCYPLVLTSVSMLMTLITISRSLETPQSSRSIYTIVCCIFSPRCFTNTSSWLSPKLIVICPLKLASESVFSNSMDRFTTYLQVQVRILEGIVILLYRKIT